jgi:hypothetical protein
MFPQLGFGEPSVSAQDFMTESVSRDDLCRSKAPLAQRHKFSKTYAGKGQIGLPYQLFRTAPFKQPLSE